MVFLDLVFYPFENFWNLCNTSGNLVELLLKTFSIISLLFSLQLRARDDDCVPPRTDVRGGETIQVRAGGDMMLIMTVLMLIMVMLMLIMIVLMVIMTIVSPSSGRR